MEKLLNSKTIQWFIVGGQNISKKRKKRSKKRKKRGKPYLIHDGYTKDLERELSLSSILWKTKEILQQHFHGNKCDYEVDILGEFLGYRGKELWVIEVKTGKYKMVGKATSQLRNAKNYLKKDMPEYPVIKTFYFHPKKSDKSTKYWNLRLEEIVIK